MVSFIFSFDQIPRHLHSVQRITDTGLAISTRSGFGDRMNWHSQIIWKIPSLDQDLQVSPRTWSEQKAKPVWLRKRRVWTRCSVRLLHLPYKRSRKKNPVSPNTIPGRNHTLCSQESQQSRQFDQTIPWSAFTILANLKLHQGSSSAAITTTGNHL